MSEKIAALVRFAFAPDAAAEEIIENTLATTRTFAGLERVDILHGQDDPAAWTLYEVWSSAEEEQAYRTFRTTPEGADPALSSALTAPPTLERFTLRA